MLAHLREKGRQHPACSSQADWECQGKLLPLETTVIVMGRDGPEEAQRKAEEEEKEKEEDEKGRMA